MKRTKVLVASVVAVIVAGSFVFAQEKKEPVFRGRGGLPPNWSKLGLTDDQKQKAYTIHAEYRGKIDDLERQIKQLRKAERTEMEKILTDSQKERLRELISERAPASAPKPQKDSPTDKKP